MVRNPPARWRQEPVKVATRITPVRAELATRSPLTFRTVAQMCGRLLWRQTLSRRPLCDFHDVIEVVRAMCKARGKQNWNCFYTELPDQHRACLTGHIRIAEE